LSVKAFRDWFKKRCREARREDRSAHRLRKLGAQRCAEAGASEHQLMACLEGEPRPARRGGGFVGGTERERTGARTGNAVAVNSARKSNKMSRFSQLWRPVRQSGPNYRRRSSVVASPRGFEPLLPP